jgi:hypothetical protein
MNARSFCERLGWRNLRLGFDLADAFASNCEALPDFFDKQ